MISFWCAHWKLILILSFSIQLLASYVTSLIAIFVYHVSTRSIVIYSSAGSITKLAQYSSLNLLIALKTWRPNGTCNWVSKTSDQCFMYNTSYYNYLCLRAGCHKTLHHSIPLISEGKSRSAESFVSVLLVYHVVDSCTVGIAIFSLYIKLAKKLSAWDYNLRLAT